MALISLTTKLNPVRDGKTQGYGTTLPNHFLLRQNTCSRSNGSTEKKYNKTREKRNDMTRTIFHPNYIQKRQHPIQTARLFSFCERQIKCETQTNKDQTTISVINAEVKIYRNSLILVLFHARAIFI